MGITSNVDSIANAWMRRARVLEPYMRKATGDATKTLHAESKAEMKRLIYDKPVPTKGQVTREKNIIAVKGKNAVPGTFIKKNGKTIVIPLNAKEAKKKAWKRTGNLQRSEKMKQQSSYLGIVENAAKYAAARHAMGTPQAKRFKKCRYPAPWRQNAIDRTRGKIRAIYRDAFKRAMREGAIERIINI